MIRRDMKTLNVILTGLLCVSAQAATSDSLFPSGGSSFTGAAGNIIFNGQQFVTPTVQSNGAIQFVFLDTNGMAVSNLSLSITGSSPRVALNGNDYLLAWLDSDSTLFCARVTNSVLSTISLVAPNVVAETISFRAANGSFLAVWQSGDSNGVINARWLASDGSPSGSSFAVAPGASPQYGPGLNNEGTNYLVCWMEQNVQSNDWRVVARFVDPNGPLGAPFDVSQSNSFRPHPTACSFGTNFLVAWSWDEGVCSYLQWDQRTETASITSGWYQVVSGRIVSATGTVLGKDFLIARNPYWNTNPVVAFGNGNFLAAWATAEQDLFQGLQRVQLLSANGSRNGYPIHAVRIGGKINQPRLCFGQGRFCALYSQYGDTSPEGTFSAVFDHEQMEAPTLINLRRTTNGSIAVESSRTYSSWDGNTYTRDEFIETSTNAVDWTIGYPRWWNYTLTLQDLPLLPAYPIWLEDNNHHYFRSTTNIAEPHRLFVRVVDRKWQCIEQLRGLDWAKQQWAVDNKKASWDTPTVGELVGPTSYLVTEPFCPHGGVYSLGYIGIKPTCSIGLNHTL